MTSKTDPSAGDPDNPEWTARDFAEAAGPDALSAAERAAFPKTASSFDRIMSGLKEAEQIAAGQADPATFRVFVPGRSELTEAERAAWMRESSPQQPGEEG